MLPWYSLVSVQMANNLIKWWRTKFLNGYKQFSVIQPEGHDNRNSDTEELLGNTSTNSGEHTFGLCEAAIPTCSTPPATSQRVSTPTPIPPTPPQPTQDKKHLNLEEISCDVSMEGGVYRDGQERQEFSFTLYDFDGHGKITKDDIAGLVTTIYETIGSSVKVPYYGSKTIKVKLTVSPDQGKRMSATVIDHHKSPTSTTNGGQQQEDNGNVRRDLNATIKDNERHRRQCRRHKHKQEHYQRQQRSCSNCITCKASNTTNPVPVPTAAPIIDPVSDAEHEYSDQCSRVSYDDISEDEGECSEDQMPKQPSCEKIKLRRYQKFTSPRHQAHLNATTFSNVHAHVPISPVLCTKARRTKKRSSSLQRKELLEIIQANMEKNNHSFQTPSRKQCPNHVVENEQLQPSVEQRKHRRKHKVARDSATQLQCLANIVNSENCYLDLTSLQSGTNQIPLDGQADLKHYCRYDKLLGAVVCMSNNQINSNVLQRSSLSNSPCRTNRKKHIRSRSHDLSHVPFRYHLLEPHNNVEWSPYNYIKTELQATDLSNATSLKKVHGKLKSFEAELEQTPAAFKKNIKKFPQVVLGHSSSPHHLKHRNRQEDQARAMAQVVRWLEQEFSSNINMKKADGVKRSKAHHRSTSQPSPNRGSSANANNGSPSISSVERHEHHHVHEHIHHHYHHYQETPVVV